MFTLDSNQVEAGTIKVLAADSSESMGSNWINAHIVYQAHNQGGKPAGTKKTHNNIDMTNAVLHQRNGFIYEFLNGLQRSSGERVDSSYNGLDDGSMRLFERSHIHRRLFNQTWLK